MALKLMEHDLTIEYRQGSNNQNADGLSRQAWISDEVKDMEGPRTRKMDAADDPSKRRSCSVRKSHLGGGGCGDAHSKNDSTVCATTLRMLTDFIVLVL